MFARHDESKHETSRANTGNIRTRNTVLLPCATLRTTEAHENDNSTEQLPGVPGNPLPGNPLVIDAMQL